HRHLRALHPFPTRRSSDLQALRAQISALAAERAAPVERKHIEISADLQPAAVQPVRLEDDEPDQDQAEHDRLQAGLRDGLGKPVDRKSTRLNSSHLVTSYA